MIDMASKQIIPAVIKYATSLADSINTIAAAGVAEVSVQKDLLEETSELLKEDAGCAEKPDCDRGQSMCNAGWSRKSKILS